MQKIVDLIPAHTEYIPVPKSVSDCSFYYTAFSSDKGPTNTFSDIMKRTCFSIYHSCTELITLINIMKNINLPYFCAIQNTLA